MSSGVPNTPTTSRVAPSGPGGQAPSPHYTTTRRHSLYGTEDRIVIDPGSRIWKVGFSGEGRPREVFVVADKKTGAPLWPDLSGKSTTERDDALITLENKLQDILRRVFFDSLLVDPRSRKVIIVEHPLIPLAVKDAIIRILFMNLQVPSVSFAPNHLLALIAAGRLTGLVLDCGHLDSVALPIYGSRPLFSCMRTTPLAGSRLNSHIRALLLKHARYTPPIGVVSSAVPQATAVPEDVLTDTVIEDVKTRCCFVGEPVVASSRPSSPVASTTQGTHTTGTGDDSMSESGSRSESRMSMDIDSPRPSSSSAHLASAPSSRLPRTPARMRDLYMQQSRATDLTLRIPGPASAVHGAIVSRAWLRIPGWVRERAAEIMFDSGDLDEESIAELVLNSLLKAPMDLRKELAGSILIAGGTAMLPGFISRVHTEIIQLLQPPEPPVEPYTISESQSHTGSDADSPVTPRPGAGFFPPAAPTPPHRRRTPHDPYEILHSLAPYIAILNHPNPPTSSTQSSSSSRNAGKAPGFAPAALQWVGASLAGALKTGAEEIIRENWEEAVEEALTPSLPPSTTASPAPTSTAPAAPLRKPRVDAPGGTAHLLPDWTRPPMRQGAPSVYAT